MENLAPVHTNYAKLNYDREYIKACSNMFVSLSRSNKCSRLEINFIMIFIFSFGFQSKNELLVTVLPNNRANSLNDKLIHGLDLI